MHALISSQKTGTPETFAKQLELSRRQMYNELELLKNLNAKIKYCKKKQTFYYGAKFDFSFNYSLVAVTDEDAIKISGGCSFNQINTVAGILRFINRVRWRN
jgi:transcriptional antiterminator